MVEITLTPEEERQIEGMIEIVKLCVNTIADAVFRICAAIKLLIKALLALRQIYIEAMRLNAARNKVLRQLRRDLQKAKKGQYD